MESVGCRARMKTYEHIDFVDFGEGDVVGGAVEGLELLAGEDVQPDQVHLGAAVLAGLGRGHLDDLARVGSCVTQRAR
jgi:hypothetical protein